MIYTKSTMLRAVKHVIPELEKVDLNDRDLADILNVVSIRYFMLDDEEVEDLNPSVKYAFVVLQDAVRSYADGEIKYGKEEAEFLGNPLKGTQ